MSDRISADNLARLYQQAAGKFGGLPAFSTRQRDGSFRPVTFAQLYERGLELATALIEWGLGPKEHVGLIADNRYEWILSDYGILMSGAADVPRATDITEAEMRYILEHSDVRLVFVENEVVLARLERVMAKLPGIEGVVVMAPGEESSVMTLEGLVERGAALRKAGNRAAEARIAAIRPEDLFTIIYTSGTTGTPKGVPLSHANMSSQIRNLPIELLPGERALSILPVWHSYERVFQMITISMGVCTHYTSLRTIGEDLKNVRPNIMASAPRLWENLYQKLMARVAAGSPVKRWLFAAARKSSLAVRRAERFFRRQELDLHGRALPQTLQLAVRHAAGWLAFLLPFRLLDPLVLAKVREAAGFSEFRGTISGGGALQPHVDEFFNSIGIPVLEGYGLTETSPVLAVRTWDHLVIGTVGRPYPQTRVRIVDLNTGKILYPSRGWRGGRGLRGEIHVSGPQVMSGYHKDPETTARVLKDGWFNTGDIGMITFNGCLKILGRSKETIVLLSGENVEPVPIEHTLTSSPRIDQCMVTGQDQKVLGAIIVPSLIGLAEAGIAADSLGDLVKDPRAVEAIDSEIRRLVGDHTGFKPFERVCSFRLIAKPFEVGTELTNTYKLKRHVIDEQYRDLIAAMHVSNGMAGEG